MPLNPKILKINLNKSTLPNIVVHGINKADVNLGEIVDTNCNEIPNLSPEDFQHYFKSNNVSKDSTMDVVFRVTPETYQAITQMNFQIYSSYQVSLPPTCKKSGTSEPNHVYQIDQPNCNNCSKHKHFSTLPHYHFPNNPSYPIYKRRMERINDRTKLFPDSSLIPICL